jgi:hypothetical protein
MLATNLAESLTELALPTYFLHGVYDYTCSYTLAMSMTFFFGDDGRLLEARAIRYNDARGRNERWVNRNDSDLEFGGIRVPAVGEARWEYDSGPYPYIRWHLTDLEQNRPARY